MPRYTKEKIGEIHRVTKVKTFKDYVTQVYQIVATIALGVVVIGLIFF